MKLHRINAVIKRHVLQMFKDVSRIFDMVYWPLVDIVLWGFTSLWMQNNTVASADRGFMLITGLVLWGVIWRSNIDVSLSFLEELQAKNLVNLFSSPLSLSEWITGMMLLGSLRSLYVFVYTTGIVWLLYGWNVYSIGLPLIAYFTLLLVSGWCIGFFIAGLLAYYGMRIQGFVWSVGWMFSIFGAIFYPLNVLPLWAQYICKALPIAHVLEAMRFQVQTNSVDTSSLAISLILNIFYLSLSLLFFYVMFNKSRVYGLARLEVD
jgi:ABC-2 type transporter.